MKPAGFKDGAKGNPNVKAGGFKDGVKDGGKGVKPGGAVQPGKPAGEASQFFNAGA